MGFRFSKRIQILPGVRLNLSNSGTSWSLGPHGASVSAGKRGVYGNVGIPGTGLSWRQRLDNPSSSRSGNEQPIMPEAVSAQLINDHIELFDPQGHPLDSRLLPAAKTAMKADLTAFLQSHETERNATIESLRCLHHDIPAGIRNVTSSASGKPQREHFPSQESFMTALMTWNAAKANAGTQDDTIAEALLTTLGELAWPAETNIALALQNGRLMLDVDLPEIEDMPQTRWKASSSQLALIQKPISQKDIAGLYLDHVSSIIVRLIGHALSTSANISAVAVSAYTQRKGSTGNFTDEYVATIEIDRNSWNSVNISEIHSIDPCNLLRHFGAKLDTNSRGVLLTQTPLT